MARGLCRSGALVLCGLVLGFVMNAMVSDLTTYDQLQVDSDPARSNEVTTDDHPVRDGNHLLLFLLYQLRV